MSERIYSKEEIQRILKKAAEKQQHAHSRESSDVGLSLDELERIAAEAGIDPQFIREAARETLPDVHERKYSRLAGGITSLHVSRTVPVTLPAEDLDSELVPVIRSVMNKEGQFEKLGDTLTWTDGMGSHASYTKVVVERENEQTRVSATTTNNVKTSGIALILVPLIMMMMVVGAIAKNGLDPGGVFAVIFLMIAIGSRIGYSMWTKSLEEKMETTIDELEDRLMAIGRRTEAPRLSDPSETAEMTADRAGKSEPIIDLDDLQDSQDRGSTSRGNTRGRTRD